MGLLLYKAIQDREWLIDSSANGDKAMREHVALTSIYIYVGGVVTQLSYLIVGVVLMTQPNHLNGAHQSDAQIINSIVFIASSVCGTILAANIYRRRNYVVGKLIKSYGRRNYDKP